MSTLDRQVAEKVMGWRLQTWSDVGEPGRDGLTGWWATSDGTRTERSEHCPDYYEPEDAWSPSTDMNAAMEVVERLLKTCKWRFDLHDRPNGEYAAYFDGLSETGKATHANPATAICLAALAAVGVEYKESDNG